MLILREQYLDLNTNFLFGEPIGVLSGHLQSHARGFLKAFRQGFEGCGIRIALGPLAWIVPKRAWYEACEDTRKFANVYVDRALQYRKEYLSRGDNLSSGQRTLLHKIAEQTDDRRVLGDQIIQAMMAATETTASLISTIVHILAANPIEFVKVRGEVLNLGDSTLDADQLSHLSYTQNVIREGKPSPITHNVF